ncbi:MAG: hypothetical protein H7A44_08580 [Opitutaceae bacterium]|nr:hypothetical protein [Cephaloticoccus sp.]MCP5530486.1 hypothetical protein [Opitutaceae bacterium]
MKPEDLLGTDSLPPDLQWIASHYQLQPDDPVYLLIAWHWQRIKASEDTWQALILEMKTALDARIELLAEAADAIAGVNTGLEQLQNELVERPAKLAKELEAQVRAPVDAAVTRLESLGTSLKPVTELFQVTRQRHLLAIFFSGIALGAIGVVLLVI